MKETIIIGTLHGGSTPKDELLKILNTVNPDNVLVELSLEELNDRPRTDSIRDEMFAAYDWAVEHHKDVDVFDIEDDILKEGITGSEPDFVELELKVKDLLKDYSWKELNRKEPWNIPEVVRLEDSIVEKYFDPEKMKARDFQLLRNITDKLKDGVNIVITGAGHLTFLKQHMPTATLPLRD